MHELSRVGGRVHAVPRPAYIYVYIYIYIYGFEPNDAILEAAQAASVRPTR